uniref:Uncharacterized protein n=1 Tax=Glossina morsitans morsitans TaxID=37546 RepID=A0A1B0G9H7_GLOMM
MGSDDTSAASTEQGDRGEKIHKGIADTGKVIWQENKDFSSPDIEHEARVPVKIFRFESCFTRN